MHLDGFDERQVFVVVCQAVSKIHRAFYNEAVKVPARLDQGLHHGLNVLRDVGGIDVDVETHLGPIWIIGRCSP